MTNWVDILEQEKEMQGLHMLESIMIRFLSLLQLQIKCKEIGSSKEHLCEYGTLLAWGGDSVVLGLMLHVVLLQVILTRAVYLILVKIFS